MWVCIIRVFGGFSEQLEKGLGEISYCSDIKDCKGIFALIASTNNDDTL